MSKSALVILTPDAEEMELVTTVEVLCRAGISVTVAGLVGCDLVKCSRDVMVAPDASLESAKRSKYDCAILPWGLGCSKAMAATPLVRKILKQQERDGRIVGAICVAPIVVAANNIPIGKSLTSYPSFKSQLDAQYKYLDDQKVVQNGNLITNRGPGTAFDFGLKIAQVLSFPEKTADVA